MTTALNAKDLVVRVRDRILDKSSRAIDDATVLRFADDALQSLYTTMRLSNQDYELDRLLIPFANFVESDPNLVETRLPEYVGEVRLVEKQVQGQSIGAILDKSPTLKQRSIAMGAFAVRNPVWFYSRHARPGWLAIAGRLGGITDVAIWYIRKWAPMHFGTATAGGANTLTFDAPGDTTLTGRVLLRDSYYVGMDVEITNNLPTGAQQQLGRSSSSGASVATSARPESRPWLTTGEPTQMPPRSTQRSSPSKASTPSCSWRWSACATTSARATCDTRSSRAGRSPNRQSAT